MPDDEQAQALTSLKVKRTRTKAAISRIKSYVESNSNLLLEELECRLGLLEAYFKQLLAVQDTIETLDPNDNSLIGKSEEVYCAVKSKILKQIGDHRRRESIDRDLSITVPKATPTVSVKSHLPKIQLPKFGGNYREYTNFMNTFKLTVDNNVALNNIEKLLHLRSCLTGEALLTIQAIDISEQNYTEALKLLEARYDNKYLIFEAHVAKLFDITASSKGTAAQIKNIAGEVNVQLKCMQSLGSSDEILNSMLIHTVKAKLDAGSKAKWEESIAISKIPTWEEFSSFLHKRCQYLDSAEASEGLNRLSSSSKRDNSKRRISLAISKNSCAKCQAADHSIRKCAAFLSLSVFDRFHEAKKLGLCLNCLNKGHSIKHCVSGRCRVCNCPHHSLLHRYKTSSNDTPGRIAGNLVERNIEANPDTSTFVSSSTALHASTAQVTHQDGDQVILAAAVVEVKAEAGYFVKARVLLDSASQLNLMTESFAQKLRLPRKGIKAEISGIGDMNSKIAYASNATIKSRLNNFQAQVEVWILPRITNLQPDNYIDITDWKIPENINLADPKFYIPQKVDLLLGADYFYSLLSVGQIRLGDGFPVLQKTVLGWIVAGRCSSSKSQGKFCCVTTDNDIELIEDTLKATVEKFWRTEDVTANKLEWGDEQRQCEEHFIKTAQRDNDGRFVLKLPFKTNPTSLGDSYQSALRFFNRLERKLSKNLDMKQQYVEFMREYERLGHMEEWKGSNSEIEYYIPHHCVLKPDSSTTKLRVVFNASWPTSTNVSLNDVLMIGPTIQSDLYSIAVRFRFKKYAVTADISKMYRQIGIIEADRKYLGILWRENSMDTLKTFKLKTVTYGTSSAPFQAIRCLHQLALDNKQKFPVGSQAIQNDMYVDDLISTADTSEELMLLRNQIDTILSSGKFILRKWTSNCTEFLDRIPASDRELLINLNDSSIVKTLGLIWDPISDSFHFNWSAQQLTRRITKRIVLSELSSLFDPLGVVNPIVVLAKIFMQELWALKLDWDESLPLQYHGYWTKFRSQLEDVNNIQVPRYIFEHMEDYQLQELHGFADASSRAYGCCVYIRSVTMSGKVVVNLLTAKSRVAPLKTLSIPKLELSAALLLATVVANLQSIITTPLQLTLWTDSEIVLHWIAGEPSSWNVFVGNRTAKILELVGRNCWRHVDTKSNPADIVSRGAVASELKTSIWFTGPPFLKLSREQWPQNDKFQLSSTEVPERRRIKTVLLTIGSSLDTEFISGQRYINNFPKLCRIMSRVLRAIKILHSQIRQRMEKAPLNLLPLSDTLDQVSPGEMEEALMIIVSHIQRTSFASEISALESSKPISPKSRLKSLAPFLDDDSPQLLRVGGRLQNADIPYQSKCPILLPKDHPFVLSYLAYLHKKHLHAGTQALIAISRQRFWILSVKVIATRVIHRCIHCFHYHPKTVEQVMGCLPAQRVQLTRPFTNVGVDFCGPVLTTLKQRGQRFRKSYVAVFICFATRAVHLEVVSDLSADAFIGALKRFISRRGICSNLFCDNATNFVGAQSKLAEFHQLMLNNQEKIVEAAVIEGIQFKFIPPRSPHFGGLWEAAVKSAKYHLRRTLHHSTLTFEELSTVIAQIEAVLNSRPISAMSSDPNDEQALTPGHFLVGGPLSALPEPDLRDAHIPDVKRWQYATTLSQHFWHRWSREYVPILQQRHKWTTTSPDLKEGTLVLIADDQLPPQRWSLGRIVRVIRGPDDHIRVADVRTRNAVFRRAIHKLAPLPLDD